MAVLKEIHDKFDTFGRYRYTDHSVISKIKIVRTSAGQYVITTYPGGIGSAFDALAIEFNGIEKIIGSSPPNQVIVSRDYGPSLFLNVESAESVDEGRLIEMSGTVEQPPIENVYVERGNPDYGLFDILHTEIQGLQPTLSMLLRANNRAARGVAHFQVDSTGSTSFDHVKKIATFHREETVMIADEAGDGFQALLDCTKKAEFKSDMVNDVVRVVLPGELFCSDGKIFPVERFERSSYIPEELDSTQACNFTRLHEEMKRLYS
ncbi:MAG: hypothetical protein AABW49_01310 [Nanoarchaeota archaeon]